MRAPLLLSLLCLACADADLVTEEGDTDGQQSVDGAADATTLPPADDSGPNRDVPAPPPPPEDMGEPPPPPDAMGEPPPPPVDMAEPPPPVDMAVAPPPALDCVFDSDTVGQPRVEIDVGPNSNERLTFTVRGLPAPGVIASAALTFDSYDADHPGQEGRIWVNGEGPFQIPANMAWDNMQNAAVVDISGSTVEGENRIQFGPGPLDRSFFGVSNVRIAARANVQACPEGPPPPDPPPADAVVREIRYPQAEYTNRRTWVLGCENNRARAYAYTATGDEHEPTDCEGIYRRGGNRVGDAIFRFDNLVEATYEIVIGSRHTINRPQGGALFLVEGEGRRISQRTDRDFTEDVWGQRRLGGVATVILRAEGNSDSVTHVRLVPVGD